MSYNEETNDGKGWVVSGIKCDLCGYEYIDVRPADAEELECPNCTVMNAYYEIIELEAL